MRIKKILTILIVIFLALNYRLTYAANYSQSYLGVNIGTTFPLNNFSENWIDACQVVQTPVNINLTNDMFSLSSVGSPTGTMYSLLYATSGTFGNATGTGSALATSTGISATTLSSQAVPVTFTFPSPPSMTANTSYAVCVNFNNLINGSNSQNVELTEDIGTYYPGNLTYFSNIAQWINSNPLNYAFVYSITGTYSPPVANGGPPEGFISSLAHAIISSIEHLIIH